MLPQSKRRGLFSASVPAIFSLLLFFLIACNNHKPKDKGGDGGTVKDSLSMNDTSIVTVAALIPSTDGKTLDVIFNEKEQVFTISKEEKTFTEFNRSFEDALRSRSPIKIISDPRKGNFSM